MPKDIKAARGAVKACQRLSTHIRLSETTEGAEGEVYAEAMRKCLLGGEWLGLYENTEETDPEVGAAMLEVYSIEVVAKLCDILLW